MSAIKQTCKRRIANAKVRGTRFSYQCPVGRVDRKREGRFLRVGQGHQSITLDGFALRTLKRILRTCGEVGRGRCRPTARTAVIGPR